MLLISFAEVVTGTLPLSQEAPKVDSLFHPFHSEASFTFSEQNVENSRLYKAI